MSCDPTLYAGEVRVIRLTVLEDGAPRDISADVLYWTLARAPGAAAVIAKTTGSGITTLPQSGSTLGQADILITSAESAALSGNYVYDIAGDFSGAPDTGRAVIVPARGLHVRAGVTPAPGV